MNLSNSTFFGYKRENGRIGVRNHVIILPVDDLSNAAAQAVESSIKGTMALPHPYGRLQFGADLDLHFRTLIGTGANPNVAAVVVICIENGWAKKVADGIAATVAVDLSDEKLSLAKALGATHTFNAADPELVEKVKKATGGGVDYSVEMAGSVRAFDTAYRITRRGGTTITAGLPPPTATWAMPSTNLVAEERTIKGSYIGTCVPVRDLPRYIALFRQGRMPVDRLLTGRLKLEEINEGFDRLHEGKAIRQVVVF